MNEHLNEQLAHAVAQTRAPVRLAVAAHEIGHALMVLACGFQPDYVRLDFGLLGGFLGGTCHMGGFPDPTVPPEQNTGWLLAWIAGHAAETRFCRLYLGMDDHAAYDHGKPSSSWDYDQFHHWRRKLGISISHERAFQRATTFFERHTALLDRLTLRLERARRFTAAALPDQVAAS